MYSKHRKYNKSSNKFNKETRTLIVSWIIGSVYPINSISKLTNDMQVRKPEKLLHKLFT